jgi:hypothetical protein
MVEKQRPQNDVTYVTKLQHPSSSVLEDEEHLSRIVSRSPLLLHTFSRQKVQVCLAVHGLLSPLLLNTFNGTSVGVVVDDTRRGTTLGEESFGVPSSCCYHLHPASFGPAAVEKLNVAKTNSRLRQACCELGPSCLPSEQY